MPTKVKLEYLAPAVSDMEEIVKYQIQDNNVYVDWILDCRQDYPWLLKGTPAL